MIVISGALVLTALVLLVIGILDTDLPFVYASIGVSLASLLTLVVGILQRRGEVLPGEQVQEREQTSDEQVSERSEGAPVEQDRADELATILAQAPAAEAGRAGSRRVTPVQAPAGPLVVDEDDRGRDEPGDDEHDEVPDDDRLGSDGQHDEAYDEAYDEAHDDEPVDDEADEHEADEHGADEDGVDDDGEPALGSGPTVLVVDGRPRYHLAECRYLIGKDAQVIGLDDAREIGFSPCGVCKPDSVVEPEGPESVPPAQERADEVAGTSSAPTGQPDGQDEPGLSFEEILFGEPVFTSAPVASQPQTSPDDERDDDTQTLPVLAAPEPDAPAAGAAQEPERDDEPVAAEQDAPAVPGHAVDEVDHDELQEPAGEAPSSIELAVPTGTDGELAPERADLPEPGVEPDAQQDAGADAEPEPEPAVAAEPGPEPQVAAEPEVAVEREPDAEAALELDPTAAAPTDERVEEQVPVLAQAPSRKAAATRAGATKAPGKKASGAKKAPVAKAAARKAPAAKKAPAKKAAAHKAPAEAATAPVTRAATTQAPEQTGTAAAVAPGRKAAARQAAARTAPAEARGAAATARAATGAVGAAAAPSGAARPVGMTVRAAAPKLPPGVLRTGPGRTAVVAAPRVVAPPARSSAGAPSAAGATRGAEQVVVTPDSRRFHRSTCRYVRDVPDATSLPPDRAREQGYARCGVCKP